MSILIKILMFQTFLKSSIWSPMIDTWYIEFAKRYKREAAVRWTQNKFLKWIRLILVSILNRDVLTITESKYARVKINYYVEDLSLHTLDIKSSVGVCLFRRLLQKWLGTSSVDVLLTMDSRSSTKWRTHCSLINTQTKCILFKICCYTM